MTLKVGTVLETGKPFTLPPEIVTEALAILAKRRVGKTYTASVIAEEMLKAHFHIVVIDPTGAWWGLRASADGKGPGFPTIVMGGDHGDVPLEETAGEVVARFVVESGQSVILDVSGFSKAGQRRFVAAFLATLYRINREPLHVFIDEADEFAPQMLRGDSAASFGAVDDVVRRGGIKGLGCSLITQRSAAINKDVLTQCEILVVLRTIAPNDRKAINAWVDVQHGTSEQQQELMTSLPSLKKGEAWFWAPGTYEFFVKVSVRERQTFDSSRTPKVGERRIVPKQLAPVDLEKLTREMQATIERKKAEDPRELRKQLVDLQRQLAAKMQSSNVAKEVEKRVEVAILKDSQVKRLEALIDKGENAAKAIQQGLTEAADAIRRAIAANRGSTQVPTPARRATVVGQGREPAAARPSAAGQSRAAAASRSVPADGDFVPSRPQQAILDGLAWLETVRIFNAPWNVVAWLGNQSPKSSGFEKNISTLRTAGLIQGSREAISLTDAGHAVAQPLPVPPTEEALRQMIYAKISGPQRLMIEALLRHGGVMAWEELAAGSNQSPTSSGFEKNVSTLKTLHLIAGTRSTGFEATSLLFLEGAAA